jgi:hypothetical protein
MKVKILIILWITALLQLSTNYINGQQAEIKEPGSMLYVHTDRLSYLAGESLFFKANVLKGLTGGYNFNIDTLFIALIDHDGNEVSSGKFLIKDKQVSGSIELSRYLTEGNYVLIAYTSGMKNATPDKIYSRIIEVENSKKAGIRISIVLKDTLYNPGSPLTAFITSSGKNEKPVATSFTYRLQNTKGELHTAQGETDKAGHATLELMLPEFQKTDTIKLFVTTSFKGENVIAGIVIPTPDNNYYLRIHREKTVPPDEHSIMNIKINTDKSQFKRNEKVELCLNVTDDTGVPLMADLSVSVSDLQSSSFTIPDETIPVGMVRKNESSSYSSYVKWDKYFARWLSLVNNYPGHSFIVQGKNDIERIIRDQESGNQFNQSGYPADRKILDIIMQIKPYQIADGKIMFSNSGVSSIYYQEGALIIVDGIKRGTDVTILNNIPITDVARINVSTNPSDIHRYTGLNSNGIIEITTKNNDNAVKMNEAGKSNKTSTIFWKPDIESDASGNACTTFVNRTRASGIIISIAGVTANGVYGEYSIPYPVY